MYMFLSRLISVGFVIFSHDQRYLITCTKIHKSAWKPEIVTHSLLRILGKLLPWASSILCVVRFLYNGRYFLEL